MPKALVPHYAMKVGKREADLDVQPGNCRCVPEAAVNASPSRLPLLALFQRLQVTFTVSILRANSLKCSSLSEHRRIPSAK